MKLRTLDSHDTDFDANLATLLNRSQEAERSVDGIVSAIIADVRARGDAALIEYTARLDRHTPASAAALEVPRARINAALHAVSPDMRTALEEAARRIRDYHQRQKLDSWHYQDAGGTLLGQQVTPLDRVGLYVPGGKAAYPSSVLMNAIPAKVAGVPELIMAVPTPDGELNDLVLAGAAIAEVDRVFAIGGAQAVAALAFGTATIPRVDKIVGPGNIYVATAKRMVFGQVAIDMIAGPSEIVVVCDGKTDPEWIAMDLFSQAEHDEDAQSILISPDGAFLDRVAAAIEKLLPTLERAAIARASMQARGALIKARDLDDALAIVNRIAPEHLELSVDDALAWSKKVRHAGAIFLGRHTPEAIGDYCAGPNHVLPTAGTARFSSPLGVYDFQKRTSLIGATAQSASELGRTASTLARGEGFTAHARSAEYRIRK
jgi:histidinol dehydrogenase